ncbi:MAG TPA: cytochrome P450 [Ktedonobacteraceae bacterium]|nr:cytochrome P450 [Ktedonobacteraceae bacterium]
MMSQSTELDLASPTFKANPYPAYARLRASQPVYAFSSSQGQSTWLIMRYTDAECVLRDERFVKDRQHTVSSEQLAHIPALPASAADLMSMSMVDFDPPDHTRLRTLVSPFFTPRQIELWRERIQQITDALIDAVEDRGRMDLIEDFASVLPLRVISEILGVPDEDGPMLHQWTKQTADSLGSPDAFQQANEALHNFYVYLLALIEKKRQAPAEDLISKLLRARDQGDHISERELVTMVFLLITAGHDTADNMIGSGMLALLIHPRQMALLKENPSLIKTAIEEFLRYRSPFMLSTMRWAREDVELEGKLIRRGDAVLISLAAVNRDEETFAQPDILDITRQENPHLAFGKGIHYCLGAPLARLEGQIAISTLLRRLPDLRLQIDPATLEWRPGWLVQGLHHLPVVF